MSSIAQNAQVFADLVQEKRQLQQRLNNLNKTITTREALLSEEFVKAGVQNIKINSGVLVYLRRELWASVDDGIQMAVFKKSEWGWMVKETVNRQTLSAEVKELEKDDEMMPILPEALSFIKVTESFKIGVRNGQVSSNGRGQVDC